MIHFYKIVFIVLTAIMLVKVVFYFVYAFYFHLYGPTRYKILAFVLSPNCLYLVHLVKVNQKTVFIVTWFIQILINCPPNMKISTVAFHCSNWYIKLRPIWMWFYSYLWFNLCCLLLCIHIWTLKNCLPKEKKLFI